MWWKSQSSSRHPRSLRPKSPVRVPLNSAKPWHQRRSKRAEHRTQKCGDLCKLFLVSTTHLCFTVSPSAFLITIVFRRHWEEANARQQLLEHLGFHAGVIEKAALEYSEDISKGVESMSLEAKSTAPMVSENPCVLIKRRKMPRLIN